MKSWDANMFGEFELAFERALKLDILKFDKREPGLTTES
jgi:hypothetical protein